MRASGLALRACARGAGSGPDCEMFGSRGPNRGGLGARGARVVPRKLIKREEGAAAAAAAAAARLAHVMRVTRRRGRAATAATFV